MLDGNGLAVSVKEDVSVGVSVGITEEVPVTEGSRGVPVNGRESVLVGAMVSTRVGESGVADRVQAMDVTMPRIKITNFRLISNILSFP